MENKLTREQLKDWLFNQIQTIDNCLPIVDRLRAKDTFGDPTEPYRLVSKLVYRQTKLSTRLEKLITEDTPIKFRISQVITGLEAEFGRATTNV